MPFLQFKGKTAVETYHYTVPHHTLAFDSASSVLEAGQTPSLDGNVIIEGDNLRALKALLPTHAGRVKCIYIDPPYNTGNEGWVYNDNLTQPQFKEWIGQVVGKEGEDACRHDKWCCMMYPRLMLLKELLREDGVIFVSINDTEVFHLRLLMNEVFDDTNFVAQIVWHNASRSSDYVAVEHEYVVVFARNKQKLEGPWKKERLEIAHLLEVVQDAKDNGKAQTEALADLRKAVSVFLEEDKQRKSKTHAWLTNYINLDDNWRIYYPVDLSGEGSGPPRRFRGEEIPAPPGRHWMSQEYIDELESDGRIVWRGDRAYRKLYIEETEEGLKSLLTFPGRRGSEELKAIMGRDIFSNPKPVRLLKHLLSFSTGGNDIILDSFAGSGTTGQAVLELNEEDGGNRKFVLVQQKYDSKDDEKKKLNICRTITAERVRRVIAGQGVPATGGAFTYARVSDAPLFGEYRDLGDPPPPYEDLAKYIFYTETSRQWDPAGMDRATGRIGLQGGTSYYLLYTPDGEANAALDLKWLRSVALADPNAKLVVYCEKFWMHRDELRRWEGDNRKSVRAMIVPFQLK